MGKYYDAIDYHSKSLQILEEVNDTMWVAKAHYNLAGVYESIGVYIEATEHLNQARFTLEYSDDKEGLARVYNLLGHTRFELEIWDQAHSWYSKALKLYENLGDSSGSPIPTSTWPTITTNRAMIRNKPTPFNWPCATTPMPCRCLPASTIPSVWPLCTTIWASPASTSNSTNAVLDI